MRVFGSICLAVLLSVFAEGSDLQSAIDRFRDGCRGWNPQEMEAAREQFRAIAQKQPNRYEPLYWQGATEFYLLLCYGLEDSTGYDAARAEALLDPAEATLERAIRLQPQDAECRAMLSSVVGFRILMYPWSAVWNGPKVLSLQKEALENEPDNPRAHYIIGAGYLRAPQMFRNVGKARKHLERARDLFAAAPPPSDPAAPRWGRTECLGLLGDLRRLEGRPDAARKLYQDVLDINPLYTPAQRALREMNDGKEK